MPGPETAGAITEYFDRKHAKKAPGLEYDEAAHPLAGSYFRRFKEPRVFYKPFGYTEVDPLHLRYPHTLLGRLPNGQLLLDVREGEAGMVDAQAPVVLASSGFISCMGVVAALDGTGDFEGSRALLLAHITYSNKLVAFNSLVTGLKDRFTIAGLAVAMDARKSSFTPNASVSDLEEILADRNQPPRVDKVFYHDNPNWGALIIDGSGGRFLRLIGESVDQDTGYYVNGRYVNRGEWDWSMTKAESPLMKLAS